MAFTSISRHEQGVQLLQRSLARGRLGHAYLFAGDQLAELAELARALDAGTTTSRALVEDSLARIADPGGEGARRGATKSASAGQYASHWKQVWQSSCRAMTGAPSSLASKTFVGQTRTQMLQPVQRESLMISITRRASRRQLLPYRLGSTRRRVPR